MNICSCASCNYEVYDVDKCIFHCDKKNWKYENTEADNEYINPDSVYDEYLFRVENFWTKFSNLAEEEFHNFVFPLFDSIYIDYSKTKATFINCIFSDDIYIKKKENTLTSTITNELLKFEDCIFYSENISIDQDVQFLTFYNGTMKKHTSINIKNSYISYLDIKNISHCSLILENSDFDKIKVVSSKFTRLFLSNLDLKEYSTLLFEDLNVTNFFIEKLSQDSRYLQFNNMMISNNINFKKIEFKNTYFNDLKVNKIKNDFKIEKTSFLGANFNSVSWGDLSNIEASRDTFRELKYVHDQQKDYINADLFYVEEMKRHKNDLTQEKQDGNNNLQDRFMFEINEQLSDYGNNWILSALWYVCVSIAFILSIKVIESLNIDTTTILTLVNSFSNIFFPLVLIIAFIALSKNRLIFTLGILTFIYLIHAYIYNYHALNEFADFINLKFNNKYKDISFIWFLHKLITGFIIYHFIVALRRKTKR